MKSIPMFISQIKCQFRSLCLCVAVLSVSAAPSEASSIPSDSPAVANQQAARSPVVQPLLAQSGSLEQAVEGFFRFLRIILSIVAVVMCLWAGLLIHDGKLREGIYAMVGTFLLLMARIIVNSLANTGL